LFGLLHRTGACPQERLSAIVLLLGEREGGLGLARLLLGLVDPSLLLVDLGLDARNICARLVDLSLGLVQSRAVVPIVDPGEDAACLDKLVVVDRDTNYRAMDTGRVSMKASSVVTYARESRYQTVPAANAITPRTATATATNQRRRCKTPGFRASTAPSGSASGSRRTGSVGPVLACAPGSAHGCVLSEWPRSSMAALSSG
jgi:hypothetical protein